MIRKYYSTEHTISFYMDIFIRTKQLLGNTHFRLFQEKSVTIVGLGAVGGHAMEALVRAGIKKIKLIDFDTIQPSNINRQLLATNETIGIPKVEAARKRIKSINPHCQVEKAQLFVCEEEIEKIVLPKSDLIIDAIDSLNPKTQLLHTVYNHSIPVISSMGAALRTDPLSIHYGDLFKTKNCPLAKHLRKRLRRRGVDNYIPAVYSTEKVDPHYQYQESEDSENFDNKPANLYSDRGRKRNILGSLPTITGIFGLTIANKAILYLAEKESL